ncbi:hypothetical protein P8452_55203 [Trifolium repens]|nr:hypothetical protein P8452_55203 [Trifolium repens]
MCQKTYNTTFARRTGFLLYVENGGNDYEQRWNGLREVVSEIGVMTDEEGDGGNERKRRGSAQVCLLCDGEQRFCAGDSGAFLFICVF